MRLIVAQVIPFLLSFGSVWTQNSKNKTQSNFVRNSNEKGTLTRRWRKLPRRRAAALVMIWVVVGPHMDTVCGNFGLDGRDAQPAISIWLRITLNPNQIPAILTTAKFVLIALASLPVCHNCICIRYGRRSKIEEHKCFWLIQDQDVSINFMVLNI